MGKNQLTVVLPGLGQLLAQQINDAIIPSTIKKITSRGRQTKSVGLERSLFNYFSKEPVQDLDLPIVSLSNLPETVLRADPCHLRADRDQLMVLGPEYLNITAEERRALCSEIAPLLKEFKAEWLQIEGFDDWLIQIKEIPEVAFFALPDITGRTIQKCLPTGKQQREWIRLWNEIQMILHISPVNEQRIASGLLPINSVWFWGMGTFLPATHRWQSVTGQSKLLLSLVASVEMEVEPLPVDFKIWLDSRTKGQHLLVLEKLDLEGDWQQQLNNMESQVFTVIWQQLRRHRISHLVIDLPDYKHYNIHTYDAWKFI